MRWTELFADLERQWESLAAEARGGEIVERTRAELAEVDLLDRLRGSLGAELRLTTSGGLVVAGELSCVGADFVLLAGAREEVLVPVAALAAVLGLSSRAQSAEAAGRVLSRLGLGHALRRIAADRAGVSVSAHGGLELFGTVQRVGADFLELAEHPRDEVPRPGRVRRLTVLPFAGVELLRRQLSS